MNTYFADMHIHIGRTMSGKPVKITGAKSLTIDNILEEASERKGIDIVGVIDSQVPEVLVQLEEMLQQGVVQELDDGGIRYGHTTLFLGAEIELNASSTQGPLHVLAFMPSLDIMKDFSCWLARHMTNISLSTQRFYGEPKVLQQKVKELGGLFIPAHIFTPFKSLYGSGVKSSITEIFDKDLIDAVELGLSSDTDMADQIPELHQFTFLTNSDAHSLKKIAREYQKLRLEAPTFKEFQLALKNCEGRGVAENYGLNPLLGKYHKTCCSECFTLLEEHQKGNPCPSCGNKRVIKGVYNRLQELKEEPSSLTPNRPPYVHQVPLDFIPKVGPKTLEKLLNHFGTEMAVMHQVNRKHLEAVVGSLTADLIIKARNGKLSLGTGGAGRYGKVKT
ncbi:uncharacterized protein (TIGR00375 family) [Scopulibacillus darangshiensis]|uniref:Uncharacterized protein (TIGR00375 family) n=1 Tax=Scopulibacillus darangshiensis TaxID=442528 RepID=A0A4R2P9X6_9BACL|nr:endonuclease Q family protein [Scopulibacillus darangshiensis]TCP31737.1 uncharacterized protein (TIGR00375 family) [Scopulibacillus darangshiensis]